LVLRNHRSHLLEHAGLNGQHLPHHGVEASADCALHPEFVPHAGDFGQQALDLPSEKSESDCIAAAAGQARLLLPKKRRFHNITQGQTVLRAGARSPNGLTSSSRVLAEVRDKSMHFD
jgi:hypothetical protein